MESNLDHITLINTLKEDNHLLKQKSDDLSQKLQETEKLSVCRLSRGSPTWSNAIFSFCMLLKK